VAKFVALLDFTEDEELRLRTRPAHREYLRSLQEQGALWSSGPWTDDTGAMLIYEAENAEEAQRLLDADPYQNSGVLANARIREWRLILGPGTARQVS
jgi:uncharacterized protein YciI